MASPTQCYICSQLDRFIDGDACVYCSTTRRKFKLVDGRPSGLCATLGLRHSKRMFAHANYFRDLNSAKPCRCHNLSQLQNGCICCLVFGPCLRHWSLYWKEQNNGLRARAISKPMHSQPIFRHSASAVTLVIVHGSSRAQHAAFLRVIDHVYHAPNLTCSLKLHINGPAIRFLEVGDKVLEIDGTAHDRSRLA